MTKIIAFANAKGGVGKSTSTVSLAEVLAANGHRVLLIDLDAQANGSLLLMGKSGDARLADLIVDGKTLPYFLEDEFVEKKRQSLADFVVRDAADVTFQGVVLKVDLIPASGELWFVERLILETLIQRQFHSLTGIEAQVGKVLSREIERLKPDYDYILFDCPPGISALTAAALSKCNTVIIPTIPDYLATLGLDQFTRSALTKVQRDHPDQKPWVLATRFDAKSNRQKGVLAAMQETAREANSDFNMFDTVIRAINGFTPNPDDLDDHPTLAQKWSGDALGILEEWVTEVEAL